MTNMHRNVSEHILSFSDKLKNITEFIDIYNL